MMSRRRQATDQRMDRRKLAARIFAKLMSRAGPGWSIAAHPHQSRGGCECDEAIFLKSSVHGPSGALSAGPGVPPAEHLYSNFNYRDVNPSDHMLVLRLEPPAPFRPHASGSIVVQEVGPPRSLKSGGPVRLSRAVFEIFFAVGDGLSRLS